MQELKIPAERRWRRLALAARPTLRYWSETEVHVYAFSIAANALLSFFPFLIVMYSVLKALFGSTGAKSILGIVLNAYFPNQTLLRIPGTTDNMFRFIRDNLFVTAASRHTAEIISLLLLLFTANGMFEPLEVALNRAWGITRNRSYLKNQLLSLGLIFACGSLAILSAVLTGLNTVVGDVPIALARWGGMVFFNVLAIPVSIAILLLIYWLLPNAKVDWKAVLPSAVVAGVALEALKYLNLLTWPLWHQKVAAEYGPFVYSVTIILWSFLGSLIILAGAEWAARRAAQGKGADPVATHPAPRNDAPAGGLQHPTG